MKIKIEFADNRGSFALDALAYTFGGYWSEKSSTDTFGIITVESAKDREWIASILDEDENVVSYEMDCSE